MSERKKGYIGQVVSGEKLAVLAKQIYAIQYTPESIDSEVNVSDLLLIELDKKDDWGDTRYALVERSPIIAPYYMDIDFHTHKKDRMYDTEFIIETIKRTNYIVKNNLKYESYNCRWKRFQ